MKFLIIMMALAGAAYSVSCSKPVCDCLPFPNGDTVAVGIKERANVYGCCDDRFALTFNGVKEDSRCPDGFNCLAMDPMWQGTAKISVRINGIQPVELEINK